MLPDLHDWLQFRQLRLQAFDIVVVPRTDIAEIYVWVNQHIQQFVPVSWGFSYNVTPVVSNKK